MPIRQGLVWTIVEKVTVALCQPALNYATILKCVKYWATEAYPILMMRTVCTPSCISDHVRLMWLSCDSQVGREGCRSRWWDGYLGHHQGRHQMHTVFHCQIVRWGTRSRTPQEWGWSSSPLAHSRGLQLCRGQPRCRRVGPAPRSLQSMVHTQNCPVSVRECEREWEWERAMKALTFDPYTYAHRC